MNDSTDYSYEQNFFDHSLFYSENLTEELIFLSQHETKHAVNVLRLSLGTKIILSDGMGCKATGTIESINDRQTSVRIIERVQFTRTAPDTTLCVGLPDRDAFEEICSTATALGIRRIVPLVADHCRKPWWNKWEKWELRFRKKTIVALKQSCTLFLPEITQPQTSNDAIQQVDGCVLVADRYGKPLNTAYDSLLRSRTFTCFIGPPGGFSPEESELFTRNGVTSIKIAPSRLRTELAVTVLCSQLIGHCL